jgi:hypothetical protein
MNNNNIPRFHHRLHLLILRRLLIFANVMGIGTYLFLRIIFYDLPFVLAEESLIIARIIGLSTGIAVGVSFLIFLGHLIIYFLRYRKQFRYPAFFHIGHHTANKTPTN